MESPRFVLGWNAGVFRRRVGPRRVQFRGLNRSSSFINRDNFLDVHAVTICFSISRLILGHSFRYLSPEFPDPVFFLFLFCCGMVSEMSSGCPQPAGLIVDRLAGPRQCVVGIDLRQCVVQNLLRTSRRSRPHLPESCSDLWESCSSNKSFLYSYTW